MDTLELICHVVEIAFLAFIAGYLVIVTNEEEDEGEE